MPTANVEILTSRGLENTFCMPENGGFDVDCEMFAQTLLYPQFGCRVAVGLGYARSSHFLTQKKKDSEIRCQDHV